MLLKTIMGNKMSCSNSSTEKYQDIPPKFDCNFSKDKLKSTLNKNLDDKVYYYVIKSVKKESEVYKQSGCGPNFEGGLITLTTCKHFMRTFSGIKEGCWIAGFTSVNPNDDNYLFYLARIEKTYPTHYELWNCLDKNEQKIKSASNNILGDIFEPLQKKDQNKYTSYKTPHKNHAHRAKNVWHDDIEYRARNKPAKLLKFDPNASYVYSKPILKIKNIGRAQRVAKSLDIFFNEVI